MELFVAAGLDVLETHQSLRRNNSGGSPWQSERSVPPFIQFVLTSTDNPALKKQKDQ